jgi:hypothetical protein
MGIPDSDFHLDQRQGEYEEKSAVGMRRSSGEMEQLPLEEIWNL